MATEREKLLARAEGAERESKFLDFKREFDPSSPAEWCELLKDIMAFANSGGGIIVFGVNNDGSPSGVDCTSILNVDIADVTNKIAKYTGRQFSDVEITEVTRGIKKHPTFIVSASDAPIAFTKPGTYDLGGSRQKTAFSQGTVYFRHGGKSEPGTYNDFAAWRDRELAAHRALLMRGMRRVVEAPAGHVITAVPAATLHADSQQGTKVRLTNNPSASPITVRNTAEVWPHRQKDFLAAVNGKLPKGLKINGHDLLCVNRKIDAIAARPEFAHKPHKIASPQYSDAYVEWLVKQATANPNFFAECREAYRQSSGKR